MAQFKFSCPHCQQHLQCEEQLSGRQIQCPACRVLIRIPSVPGHTADYSPESGQTWATFVAEPQPRPGQQKAEPPQTGAS